MTKDVIKTEIEKWLREYFIKKEKEALYNKRIYEAMSYSINIGGKRIRPILLLSTYNMYRDNYLEILPAAGAIEMIHTYSLIHDDLPCMDNDDLRRGFLTNHKVFGDAIAVLAGDGLLNEAINVLLDFSLGKEENYLQAVRHICGAAGAEGMIGGQVVDILSEGKKIPIEELEYMHRKKTGALITSAIISGATLAEASEKDITILTKYGDKLGMAFQIKDDILDVIGDEKKLGKSINSDINNNKTNYVSVFGLEKCKFVCEELTNECMELLSSLSVKVEDLKEITNFLLKREC